MGTCGHFSNTSPLSLGLIHKAYLEVILTLILIKEKKTKRKIKTKKGKNDGGEVKEIHKA